LVKLIASCWKLGYYPAVWRRGLTTLIHKKGDVSNTVNVRPITLLSTIVKVMGGCIRNKLWRYFHTKGLIDVSTQKGFWPGIAGVTEHVELMKYLLKLQK